MIRANIACSVRYSRSGSWGADTGSSRLPPRHSALAPSKCRPSLKPFCACVRGHQAIDDNPPSDQPTPNGPSPSRLL
jgi:hypothetical protein